MKRDFSASVEQKSGLPLEAKIVTKGCGCAEACGCLTQRTNDEIGLLTTYNLRNMQQMQRNRSSPI